MRTRSPRILPTTEHTMPEAWVVWLYDSGENNCYGPFSTERAAHAFLNASFCHEFNERTDRKSVL
jgi:hypothetical protein